MKLRALILALVILPTASGKFAVSLSTPVSTSAFQCLQNYGYSFALVRLWQNTGVADLNGIQTIKNGWTVKMPYVDGYILPCFRCGRPEDQVRTLMFQLNANAVKSATLWLGIESPANWSADRVANVNFIRAMANELRRQYQNIGFYTSMAQWTAIVGTSTEFASYPLLYANSDGRTSFYDFQSFGGWRVPAMKQYLAGLQICGVLTNVIWHP